jgi:arylsulfatase A-like enzyme
MSDQQKATASHLYGNQRVPTPSLERLAGSGVLYEQAHTPHPLCMPARVSMWSGLYSHTHGGRTNRTPMPRGVGHAFSTWKANGYCTGLIGKNHCFEGEDLDLFDVWCEIGHHGPAESAPKGMEWVEPLEAVRAAHASRQEMPRQADSVSYAVTDHPLEHYSSSLVARQTVRYLEGRRKEPFALWVSFPDPHPPYELPRAYAELFSAEETELPPWRADELDRAPERLRVLHRMLGIDNAPEVDARALVAAYYGMTRFVDDGLGLILDALERLGLREDTIVVYCSDHGDFAGEHRMMGKGGMFFDCLTRVPLVLSWPGSLPERVLCRNLVSLLDVLPTLYRLQGIEAPHRCQGKSLPMEEHSQDHGDAVFAEYGAGGAPVTLADLERLPEESGHPALYATLGRREAEGRRKMVRTQDWKYVHDPMGDEDELYDLRRDPWELTNVAQEAGNVTVVDELRMRLLEWSIMTEGGPSR